MERIIKLSEFKNIVEPEFFLLENYDEYEDPPDPEDPECAYSEDELLFEGIEEIPPIDGVLLKGKPQVGGGIWLLLHEGAPDKYLAMYDDYFSDKEGEVWESTYPSWATDIWRQQKQALGAGVDDYENRDDLPLLIKIDEDLRNLLLDDIESFLTKKYSPHPSGFLNSKKYGPLYSKSTQEKSRNQLRHSLYFLKRTSL